MNKTKKGFASDNNSGVHPLIMQSLISANQGHELGYGDDCFTKQAVSAFKKEFGEDTGVFFAFNGTGANVIALSSLINSYHSIICADTAHIYVDECGAPEKHTGSKLIIVKNKNGKIEPEDIKKELTGFGVQHHSQPGVISISQVTELGTVYTVEEIRAITDLAHSYGLYVHMDGARLANAAVALNLPFKTFTRDAGIDVLSFGGTKNGMMIGEAVLFFRPELINNVKFIRKQTTQLYSKMRFISAQFIAYFENDLWKKNAEHSNKMAKLLEKELSKIKEIKIAYPVESNGVFAIIPKRIIPELLKKSFFYVWDESDSIVRWMASFDTKEEEIYDFVKIIKDSLKLKI